MILWKSNPFGAGKTMLSVMEHSGHFYAQVYP
jgi:hypothetical protein